MGTQGLLPSWSGKEGQLLSQQIEKVGHARWRAHCPLSALVKEALRSWSKQLFVAIADGVDGNPRRKWATINTVWTDITEQHVTVQMQRHDAEVLEYDVTHCKFAEFFRALGEPELGALLICEADFDIAAAGSGEVALTRNQTIMPKTRKVVNSSA
jgi:L-2-amino-thiazoline-4-carboxylic acid hydrolase